MGDKVLRYNLRRADRKGGKQTDPWDGPYEVDKVCAKGLYCLVNASTKVPLKTKVNGCNLKPFFESASNVSPATSTSISQSLPSTSVHITGLEQKEVTHKFSPLTVATQREICSNSGGQLVFKKKSGPSGKRNKKIFKNTSEPLDVKIIEGDGNCLFRALSFVITGEEAQHAIVRSLICDYVASTENIKVDKMREDKVWGTTTEIFAAANMFSINIFTWAKFGASETWHKHRPKGENVIGSVYFTNIDNHFNVVLRI